MNLLKLKKIASSLLDVGLYRIKINNSKITEEFKPEFTRVAVKKYLEDKVLIVKKIKGVTRHISTKPKKIIKKKTVWLDQVRRLRKKLKSNKSKIDNKTYRTIYLRIKSNIIKTNKQLDKNINDKLYKEI